MRKLYKEYYGVVFTDECTLNESARLLYVALTPVHAKTPQAKLLDVLVRVVVFIASRKCSREVEVEALFPKLKRGGIFRVLNKIFERFPVLKEYYVVPRTREAIRDNIIKIVACLESNGLIESTVTGDIVKHSVELLNRLLTVRNRTSTIGALIYLSTNTLGLKMTQRNIAKCTGTSLKALQHALIKIKRALRINTAR